MDEPEGGSLVREHLEQLLEYMSDTDILEPERFRAFFEFVQVSLVWGAFVYVTRTARALYGDGERSGAHPMGQWLGDTFFTTPRELLSTLKTVGSWRGHVTPVVLSALADRAPVVLYDNGRLKPSQVLTWLNVDSDLTFRRTWLQNLLQQSTGFYLVLQNLAERHPVLGSQFAVWRGRSLVSKPPA